MQSIDDMFLNDFGFPDEENEPAKDTFELPEINEEPFNSDLETANGDKGNTLEDFDYSEIGEELTQEERETLRSVIEDAPKVSTNVEHKKEPESLFENEFISDLPVIDVEREAELSIIKEKKIKTPEESRFLAEAKAHDRAEALRLFKRLVEEAVSQLKTLPELDAGKIYEVCERATIPVKPMADFRDCAETLSQAQNMYSELSDCYEAAYVVYQNWKRHKEKLFKAFYTISSMPSDSTREGEAFLYMSKLADREAEYKTLVERLEIAMKKVSLIRDSASRMITALENQYTAFGALRPSMDYEGPVKE